MILVLFLPLELGALGGQAGLAGHQAPEDLGGGGGVGGSEPAPPLPPAGRKDGQICQLQIPLHPSPHPPGGPALRPRRLQGKGWVGWGGGGQEAPGSSPPPSCPTLHPHLWLELAAPGLGTRGTGAGTGDRNPILAPCLLLPGLICWPRDGDGLAAPESWPEAEDGERGRGRRHHRGPSCVPGTGLPTAPGWAWRPHWEPSSAGIVL